MSLVKYAYQSHLKISFFLLVALCLGCYCSSFMRLIFESTANSGLFSSERTTRVQSWQLDSAPCGLALVKAQIAC